tara:strand:+ start:3529 stop:3849 length:321 start_codon:yes stop_codon:yes gene_type:complete
MTRLAVLAAAALVAAFLMPAAKAQQMPIVCQPHSKISAHLLQAFREVVVVTAVAGSALFELYASKSGTWTVVVTRPSMNNLACIQGTGTGFEFTGAEFPADPGDPA